VQYASDHRCQSGHRAGAGRGSLEKRREAVYAGTRQPLAHSDGRVTPLTLDVTNAAEILGAVESVESLDILINNAGLALYEDLSDRAALEQSLAVNLFGPYRMTQAFLPLLTRFRGAVVNVLSLASLAPAFHAGLFDLKGGRVLLTQSLRALLGAQGLSVHAVLAGPVDTDSAGGLDIPKASPEPVARAIFDGVEKGEEEISDPVSASIAENWRSGAAKALERQFAALVRAEPVR
jgi:NAD(P)-dependent dehydrogenase (short-subunit alcohol dehydrogenase family)